jgi:hypothetical protein
VALSPGHSLRQAQAVIAALEVAAIRIHRAIAARSGLAGEHAAALAGLARAGFAVVAGECAIVVHRERPCRGNAAHEHGAVHVEGPAGHELTLGSVQAASERGLARKEQGPPASRVHTRALGRVGPADA